MVRVTAEVKEATRARLLAAAAEEFARAGFERASIDAISLAAGYSKGTIYNYFPSKDELFLAVVEQAVAQAAATRPARPHASAWDRLIEVLGAFCGWAGQHDSLARVLVRECLMGTPGLYLGVIGAEWPLTAQLEDIIADGMQHGELRSDLPAGTLALAVAGLTDLALVQHWATAGTTPSLAEIPELVLTLLLGHRPASSR